MELKFLLRSCKLFADLDPRELAGIELIAWRKDFCKGDILFHEGEPTHGFWLVASGAVKVYRTGPDGRDRVLHVLEAGETFAEAALFMDVYPATAEALTTTVAVGVEKNGFKQLLAHDQRLNLKIIITLVRWLREMRDQLTDLTLKEVPARFASYALSLPEPKTVHISKTTVAQMLGTTKETFSRLLNRLAKAKILTYRGNQIKILNLQRLTAIANGDEKI
jgi:CRP/FNR family transcriptional regulator